ncbi:MAG: glycoside hydrolase family 13 protein [Clostridia bacterium]|nr:glycoside hydrolase family 13 protein [Clostridia bacterium]
MNIFHDSRDPVFRTPQGAVPCGETLCLRLRAEGVHRVQLRLWWQDSETLLPMKPTRANLYECELALPREPGLLWYFFVASDMDGRTWYLGNAADGLGGVGCVSEGEPGGYQVTVYSPDYATPEWMRNGMMMQIMVDRFYCHGEKDIRNLPPASYYHIRWDDDPALIINDDKYGDNCNNDYFGGNLRGVEEKLDYIQSLGVTVLYFNPIFKARSNHKYNTGDYMQIDPSFGTEADFRALCAAAEARGIRVILDGVFSHTGSDSLYFNRDGHYGSGGAYNDPDSPYREWYRFRHWPDDYECWWNFRTLPNVHEETESYQDFIIRNEDSVIAHWLRAGACGWRLDVADELPMAFIRRIRSRLRRECPDGALIGEVWEDPTNKITYGEMRCYSLGDTLDSCMNYPLRDAILDFMRCHDDAGTFVRRLESLRENMPAPFFYSEMNLLGSHDTARAISVLADIGDMAPDRVYRHPFMMDPEDYRRGRRRMIAAWQLICALPGMPCLYYGDEAGLTGMADPYNRATYPWGREDKALVETYRRIMNDRMSAQVLRTGDMRLGTLGSDVVLVERQIVGGKDVFGGTARDDFRALAVNRCGEQRRVEYGDRVYEIPPESALWLRPAPEKKKRPRAEKWARP